MTKVLFMERDCIVPGIDDGPITYEEARIRSKKLVERVLAQEAQKQVQSETM